MQHSRSALSAILESQSKNLTIQTDQSDPISSPVEADKYFGHTKKALTKEKQKRKSDAAISAITKHHAASLLTPKEAAEYIRVGEKTLAVWRCTGRYNIPFIKVGRLVKYRKSVLDAFLDSRTHGGKEI